ncbi:MAG: ABC transporter substrate-binding protein [Acidimicrobiia bacterium]|nr:ABC transporter substrate-binding protein [Acidimicrobiia bacterium]
MNPHKVQRLLSVGVTLALFTTACGGGGESESSGAASGPPQPGGEITIAVDAESDGFNPSTSQWSPATTQMALSMLEPLMTVDAEENVGPFLAESMTPNDDFTEWTLNLRPDVTFSSGNPVDAEAVKFNLDAVLASPLTGPVMRGLAEPEIVDDLTLKLSTDRSWATLPLFFAGQPGYIGDPEWLGDPDSDPQAPVGSGPFVLKERTLDAQTVVVRNENYWRDPYPYLDGITFRIVPDTVQRVQALETGEVDLTASQDDGDVVTIQENPDLGSLASFASDESMIMLNTSKPPLDDIRVREALAVGMDREAWATITDESGLIRLADSPWPPESRWHPDGLEFPDHDPERARELLGEYEAETGETVSLTLGTTSTPEAKQTQEIIAEQWRDLGIDVETTTTEQATLITDVIAGNFDALVWRQFNSPDPDGESHWWFSQNTEGPVAVNFARNRDPVIDEALYAGRATDDLETRKAAYRTVAERLNADLPYLWLRHTTWIVGYQESLQDVGDWDLPDGDPGIPVANNQVRLFQIWLAS